MDTKLNRYKIAPDLLGVLGTLIPGNKNGISPLRFSSSSVMTASLENQLKKAGVLTEKGSLFPEAEATLSLLAEPGAFVGIRISMGARCMEHTLFYGPNIGRGVVLSATNDGIEICDPANVDELVTWLGQFIGNSFFTHMTYLAELDILEGLALAAVMDLQRRNLLQSYADPSHIVQAHFDIKTINQMIQDTPDSPDWFVAVVKKSADIKQGQVTDIDGTNLTNLAKKGHIVPDNKGYLPGKEIKALAAHFLKIDKILTLKAGTLTNNINALEHIDGGSMYCLNAGVNDTMMIDTSDKVRFSTISTANLQAYLRVFLRSPEKAEKLLKVKEPKQVLPEKELIISEESVQKKPKFCSECGQPLDSSARFCADCGAKI